MLLFILLSLRVTFQSSHKAVGSRWLITTPTVPQTVGRELKFQFHISPQKATGFYLGHHLFLGGGDLFLGDLLCCPTAPGTLWTLLQNCAVAAHKGGELCCVVGLGCQRHPNSSLGLNFSSIHDATILHK